MVRRYEHYLRPNARSLRSNLTDVEKLLWSKVRRNQLLNFRFNRQKPIGPYIVDFHCAAKRLIVEIDGGQHYLLEGMAADSQRDAYFSKQGYTTLRFSNREILAELDSVLAVIEHHLGS